MQLGWFISAYAWMEEGFEPQEAKYNQLISVFYGFTKICQRIFGIPWLLLNSTGEYFLPLAAREFS